MTLLEMSLSASAIILLTAVLRLLAGGRLPRRMYMALWDIAALRLLLPVKITSSLSLEALAGALLARAQAGPVEGVQGTAAAPLVGDAGMLTLDAAAAQSTMTRAAITRPQAAALVEDAPSLLSRIGGMITPERVLLAVWLVGALLLAAHFSRAYARSMRLFGESLPDTHPETDMFLRAHPMRRRVRVRLSGHIASPLSYGVLRPVILLPRGMDHENTRALSYVLLHELMHIRALDAARKLLVIACLCLHWMNPLVALMFLLVNRDMELLCDERVLAASPGDARREYALTLLAMEERKARLSPVASSFSVNAIEERIKAMKNMKKKSAASLLLALIIVVTSSAALATSAPEAPNTPNAPSAPSAPNAPKAPRIQAAAGAANQTETTAQITEGEPFLTRKSWEEVYAKYAPFGLGYDAERGRLTYEGKLVRLFEDMYPVGEQTEAGTVCAFETGEVDVYAVRDLTGPILRNADGSFDPSGELIGLRQATQEEFDALTRERENAAREPSGAAQSSVAQDAQTILSTGYLLSDTYYYNPDGGKRYHADPNCTGVAVEYRPMRAFAASQMDRAPYNHLEPCELCVPQETELNVTWWTADEYRAWMENEREVLLELAQEEAWAYTGSDGWFQWTPEKVEETMALYESILRQIEDGALVSKTVDGSEDTMLMQSIPNDDAIEAFADRVAQSVPSDEELERFADRVAQSVPSDEELERFTQRVEEDATALAESIVQSITEGLGVFEETEPYEENEEWTDTIAPYEAVGLRWWTDPDGSLRMAVGNCEARGIWDAERGMWITWSMGHSRFDENAKEFIAVYDGDRLTGLRQADESEAAYWDKQRGIE